METVQLGDIVIVKLNSDIFGDKAAVMVVFEIKDDNIFFYALNKKSDKLVSDSVKSIDLHEPIYEGGNLKRDVIRFISDSKELGGSNEISSGLYSKINISSLKEAIKDKKEFNILSFLGYCSWQLDNLKEDFKKKLIFKIGHISDINLFDSKEKDLDIAKLIAKNKSIKQCTFCSKTQLSVELLISGVNGHLICDACVKDHLTLLTKELSKERKCNFCGSHIKEPNTIINFPKGHLCCPNCFNKTARALFDLDEGNLDGIVHHIVARKIEDIDSTFQNHLNTLNESHSKNSDLTTLTEYVAELNQFLNKEDNTNKKEVNMTFEVILKTLNDYLYFANDNFLRISKMYIKKGNLKELLEFLKSRLNKEEFKRFASVEKKFLALNTAFSNSTIDINNYSKNRLKYLDEISNEILNLEEKEKLNTD